LGRTQFAAIAELDREKRGASDSKNLNALMSFDESQLLVSRILINSQG